MDIGNAVFDFPLYLDQAALVVQEFSDQYDMEKERKIPMTDMFEYKNYDEFLEGQIKFINFFVLPLYKEINQKFQIEYDQKIEVNV